MSEIIRHEVDDELAYSGFVEAGEYRTLYGIVQHETLTFYHLTR